MNDSVKIFTNIDNIIDRVNLFKNASIFEDEILKRKNRKVSAFLNDSEILKAFAYLIAYSQNANSERVERLIKNGAFDTAFKNFEIDKVVKMNPCDVADNYWSSISAIRQQGKLFHIVSLARKLKTIGSISAMKGDMGEWFKGLKLTSLRPIGPAFW